MKTVAAGEYGKREGLVTHIRYNRINLSIIR